MRNLVAIVGRPNVGKSTLFNRLTQTRQAIVNEEAGTTRDRQYGKSEWIGQEFSVVDTGGWVVNSDDVFEEEIRKQVLIAVDEADVILFVVDVKGGVTDLDMEVASILRRCTKPVLLVANKTDNNNLLYDAAEFYRLGLGDPYCISALTGSGTGDLLDIVVGKFRKDARETIEEDIPRFAVVGRPNVGKSSIVNALMGEERNIVTDIAGTTRDSIYTRYNKFGFDFYLVDTAGIRKKNKVNEDLEYYSVIRSIRAIENSDVCVLMLDATRGIEGQEQQGAGRRRQQVGPGRREDREGDEDLRGGHPQAFRPLYRLPHHFRFGPHQAAHSEGARRSPQRLPQSHDAHLHGPPQRRDAPAHRGLSAPLDKGQVHQDKVRHPAAQYADTFVCVLCQSAAVREGALSPFSGEQHAPEVEPQRYAHQHLYPSEVKERPIYS